MQNDTPFIGPSDPPHEEVHLSDYLAVLFRRRRALLLTFLAVVSSVTLYTFLAPPVYEATATLHVRDDKVKGGDFLADIGLSRENPIETEIEILRSRTNVEEVVRRLHLDWVVERKSEDLEMELIEFASTAEEPLYQVRLTGPGAYEVSDAEGRAIAAGMDGKLLSTPGLTLLLQGIEGDAGGEFRLSLSSFQEKVKGLREAIRASEVGKGTNIIRVSYQDHDPRVAEAVVNTLAEVYLERSVVLKTQEASRSVEFIGDQLVNVRESLDRAEHQLEEYKSASGVVQLDAEAQSMVERVSDAEQRLAAVTLRQRQAQFALEALQQALRKQESYAPAILLEEPVVASLARSLAELEVEKRGLLVEYSSAHPAVVSLQDRISELQSKLLETYRTILSGLEENARNLRNDLNRYEGILKKLPQAELELARLTRQASVNADIYTFLLQKQQEARIAKASTISNIDVIDPAITPEIPVKPQKKKNLLLGLIVGGMLGVGVAFFREYLDDSIKDAETAKRLLGLPVLSVIPFIGSREDRRRRGNGQGTIKRALIANQDPQSPASEAFRSLRTGLHFAGNGKSRKVLLVTSTFPSEGKTTISANLAVTMAQTGSRVLLIGCDLRKPTLHELFDRDKLGGLTELLVGDIPLEEAVHSTGIYNLDFIAAGAVPPNPAELLGSEAMAELLKGLRERYDTILLDAPPVLAVTDAAVLTLYCDLLLVVIEAGGTGSKPAQRMLEVLRASGRPFAGMVINDKTGVAADYSRYYGERYLYRYGYAEEAARGKRPVGTGG